ncbi:MAG: GNAT family N-acetyltransferase, partial [Bdellovibrionota bacterium]
MSNLRQIVAMGGGGFSMEPDNSLLDRYVLGLAVTAGKRRPKICFIPTASGDSDNYVERFYRAFGKLECTPSHLSLFKGTTPDLEALILAQDILYVGGGNTRNLLTLWRDWGLDQAIRKAYQQGIVLSGISAGSICWFEQGVTDSIPGRLSSLSCLGILEGSNCPHYDGETNRRPAYHRMIEQREIGPGFAAEDGVALHFVEGRLAHVVSSHPEKRAYGLSMGDTQAVEEPVEARYLGGPGFTLIRRAAKSDAPGIHDAHMRSIREVCGPHYTLEEIAAWGGRAYNEERRLRGIRENLIWVVENDGRIEGYGELNLRDPAGAYLHALYLTPAVLKRGLGRRILALMEEEIRTATVPRRTLDSTLNS